MKDFRIIPQIALLVLIQFFATSSIIGQSKSEKIQALLNTYTEYGQFNGSALVSENSKVIYKGGHGWANMEWDIPNAADTKHRLGSITKQFTAMLIMQLVEAGKLDLQVPISTYLPEYPNKDVSGKITLHHLLTHSSGIPSYTSFPGFFQNDSRDPYTPKEFVEVFADSTLEFVPGEKFNYSNSGYFLLGVIIEEITGMSYEEALHEMIFTPLGMDDSGYDNHRDILKRRATGYEKNGNTFVNSRYLDMTIPYAAGSMYATVEDLYKWDQGLYANKILSKAEKEKIFAQHMPAWGGHYGYGFSTRKDALGTKGDSIYTISHGGGINGFNTLITRLPEDKSLVVLFSNTGGAALRDMTFAIANILHDLPYEMPKRSLANMLSDKIHEDGIAEAKKFFITAKESGEYNLDEGEMNNLGYELMGNKKLKAGVTVFKLNMEAFPDSWNAYDSYAEGLLNTDQKDEAIKYYKKSIEMNPGNQNGIDMLKKMGVDAGEIVKEVNVDIKTLDTYLGKYELMPGFVLTVTREENQLMTQATGQENFPVFAKSQNEFYLKVVDAQLTFNKGASGKIETVTLNQGGQELIGQRIK